MPFKTFVAGTTALASDINTYLMNQSVMVFTNSTTRDAALTAPTEGMVAYLTASDHYTIYNGTAWVIFDIAWNAYNPTMTGITLGTGNSISTYYARIGKTVVYTGRLSTGTSPSAVTQITFSLPVNPALAYNAADVMGVGVMRDNSAAVNYQGTVRLLSGTPYKIGLYAGLASGTYLSEAAQFTTVPFTWATAFNHQITWTVMYQGV